jgi:hypothetical protein
MQLAHASVLHGKGDSGTKVFRRHFHLQAGSDENVSASSLRSMGQSADDIVCPGAGCVCVCGVLSGGYLAGASAGQIYDRV